MNEERHHLEQRKRKGILTVNLGLVANIFLAGLKTSIGILGHSPALLADGINSVSDVAYGIVVSVLIRLAGRPPDEEHPYGHDQMESVAAVVVGSFVMTTAIAIFWDAVNSVYDLLIGQGDFSGAAITALWVALLTVTLKLQIIGFIYGRFPCSYMARTIISRNKYAHQGPGESTFRCLG